MPAGPPVYKPICLTTSGDLQVIPAASFDTTVLPSTIIRSDGSTAFAAAQSGQPPVAGSDLTTKTWVLANTGSSIWLDPVLSMTLVAQPGHVSGARYLIPASATGAQWAGQAVGTLATDNGTTWTFTAPVESWVTRVLDLDIFVRYAAAGGWADIATVIHHNSIAGLQGGTTNQYYHLTSAQYAAFGGSQPQHYVYAAPLNSSGAPGFRPFDASDILTGVVTTSHGGFGLSTSSATGYSKWSGGVPSFIAAVPWADLSGVPSTFTPSAHASSHGSAGSDPVALDASQVTTGQLSLARGGTATDGSSVGANTFFAAPNGSSGAASFRLLVPSDISGATAANQILRRNLANTGNEWADLSSVMVPITRIIATTGYLAGGGNLTTDRTLSWTGVDVASSGSVVGRRPIINFTGGGATVTDNSSAGRVDIAIPAISMDPIVAAIVFGD